jgi:polysaccharide chain length determinant protein (PEP-CTERM system associated)
VIPGKQYKPEDILEAAWRRRWFILLPLVVCSIATFTVSQILPDRYRSEAVLLIVPQRVPENYVRPTVTTRLDERLQAIGQQLLSRTQLERIIQEFDLYSDERRSTIMEDVVETMRTKHIRIGPRGGPRADSGAFAVSFESDNPRTAMLVTERLASLFIRANIEDRAVFAEMTDQFLQSQLADARRGLMEREKKLEAFRRANAGRLPSESSTNQQAMLSTQMQLQSLQESINRDRDRQTTLQRLITDLVTAANAAPPVVDAAGNPLAPVPAARQLEIAQTTLRNMQMRLKPDHPDIKAMKRHIRDVEQKVAAETLEQPVSPVVSVSKNPADVARQTKLSEYQAEAEAIERRIAGKQEGERRLLTALSDYRRRLEAAPGLESELTELMRDYTTMQETYQSLLTKSQEAKVAANLERRQIGEQFKIIDNARLPQRPTSPNRLRINLIGVFVGLVMGLGVAALLEYRDSSLRTEDDVVVALSLPVLALVPTMMTSGERDKQKRHRLLLASSGVLALVLSAALIAWKFGIVDEWIR